MLPEATLQAAAALLEAVGERGLLVATAESCTGGLLAAALTHHPGSSSMLDRGFVTYSNESKIELLGVDPALIEAHGAVSGEVAGAMAAGAIERSRAGVAVSVTGVAGPAGGSVDKPVGMVWFGCARRGRAAETESRLFAGDRAAVRAQSVAFAIHLLARAAAVPG